MDPVVVGDGLLAVLPDPHVPEGRLAGELHAVHQDVYACCMSDNLARRTFHAGPVFLKR